MKRILLLIIGLLLLIGAGFGAWIAYQKFADKLLPPKEEKPAEEPPPKIPRFVRIAPITLPVIGEKRVEQFVTFQIALEVDDEGAANKVQEQMPRMIDAFIRELHAGIGDGALIKKGLVDVAAAKARLLKAATKVMGPDLVRDALIQMVLQRNL